MKKILLVIFLFLSIYADTKEDRLNKLKKEFDTALQEYKLLKQEIKKLKSQYFSVADITKQKELRLTINKKQKNLKEKYQKAVLLKNQFNSLSYKIAKEKFDKFKNNLEQNEVLLVQKGQSCKELTIDECKKLAYNLTKKEVEKKSKTSVLEKIEKSDNSINKEKAKENILPLITEYKTLDSGYFYLIKAKVGTKINSDEHELMNIDRITWNEEFEEPTEIPMIAKDNIKKQTPQKTPLPENSAPSVYHSGFYISALISGGQFDDGSQNSGSENGFGFGFGYKDKAKNKLYFEYQVSKDEDKNDLSFMGVHADFAINLQKIIYPYFGVGFNTATLKGDGYKYSGYGIDLRLGMGYEISDVSEIDCSYSYNSIEWTVANGDKNIADLGVGRVVQTLIVTYSYFFGQK